MSRKVMTWITLIMTIGFLVLGGIFKRTAEEYKGFEVSFGTTVNGEFIKSSSGRMGDNPESYEAWNNSGTMFFALSGVSGLMCVISVISQKKKGKR